jgi:hypothetical protein
MYVIVRRPAASPAAPAGILKESAPISKRESCISTHIDN